jgi:signal transduction histidine kinase
VDVSAGPLGGQAALCVLVRDVGRQREAERRLREAAEAAEAARERAEDLLRLKSSLLQDLSHEIRTPLTGILGYADLLAETVEGEGRDMALVIERGARRLMHTVNSVLDLAQLESGEGGVEVGPVDLAAEAGAVRDALAPLADAKGVALRLDRPPAPVWVQAEAGALARLLNNLVGNALKFTDEGTVRVVVRAGGGRPALVVRDTGVGIPASFLPHLFDEFRRARTGSSDRHGGTGLGLAISRRLVEVMGGTITVESAENVGTEFTVRLRPAEVPARPRVGRAVAAVG